MVLVVDDDDAMRAMLLAQLRRARLEARAAASVEEALALLERDGADVVVSDVRMFPRDGFDLLERVRGLDAPAPVILMTGFAAPDLVERARRAGAFHVLSKPFAVDHFCQVLERALARQPADSAPPPGESARPVVS